MAFKFSLQSVLDYRQDKVEGLEIELARARAVLQQQVEWIATLDLRRRGLLDELRQLQTRQTLDLGALQFTRATITRTERQLENERLKLAQLETRVAALHTALLAAKQDQETLETLKAKGQDAYRQDTARREDAAQDEIYVAQAHRRKTEAEG
jgi:flagellar export protein FliJ